MGDLVSNHLELPCVVASRGRNPDNPKSRKSGLNTEQQLELNRDGVSNCVTTVAKDNWIIEPMVLKKERTVIGKKFRKQYESKEISMNRKEISKSVPRTDGCTNTITTVQKDNYLVEPVDAQVMLAGNHTKCGHNCGKIIQSEGDASTVMENHGAVTAILEESNPKITKAKIKETVAKGAKHQQDLVNDSDGISATLVAGSHLNSDTYTKTVVDVDNHKYPFRIRKLTPKECWRLQGFDDEDIDRCIASGVSSSQLYKQAGNSIAVNCLCAIFQNLLGTPCDSMPAVDVESRLF